MARFTEFKVWQEARVLLPLVSKLSADMRTEGDLKAQLRRAVISVASNIPEGCERGSDRDFLRFLRIANASCAEAEAQLTIAAELGLVAVDAIVPAVMQAQRVMLTDTRAWSTGPEASSRKRMAESKRQRVNRQLPIANRQSPNAKG